MQPVLRAGPRWFLFRGQLVSGAGPPLVVRAAVSLSPGPLRRPRHGRPTSHWRPQAGLRRKQNLGPWAARSARVLSGLRLRSSRLPRLHGAGTTPSVLRAAWRWAAREISVYPQPARDVRAVPALRPARAEFRAPRRRLVRGWCRAHDLPPRPHARMPAAAEPGPQVAFSRARPARVLASLRALILEWPPQTKGRPECPDGAWKGQSLTARAQARVASAQLRSTNSANRRLQQQQRLSHPRPCAGDRARPAEFPWPVPH